MFLLLEKSGKLNDDVINNDLSFGCVCFSGSAMIGREHDESVVEKSQKCQNKNVNVSQLPSVGRRWDRQNNSLSILGMPTRGIFKNPKLSFFKNVKPKKKIFARIDKMKKCKTTNKRFSSIWARIHVLHFKTPRMTPHTMWFFVVFVGQSWQNVNFAVHDFTCPPPFSSNDRLHFADILSPHCLPQPLPGAQAVQSATTLPGVKSNTSRINFTCSTHLSSFVVDFWDNMDHRRGTHRPGMWYARYSDEDLIIYSYWR